MATAFIAAGTSAATGGTTATIPAGSSILVYLTDADGGDLPAGGTMLFEVQDGSNWYRLLTMKSTDAETAKIIYAPSNVSIVVRARRLASDYGASIGASYAA